MEFKDLDKQKIKITDLNQRVMHYVPNIISMNPVDQLFSATEWLVNEAINDWNTTHGIVEERREQEGYSQKNLNDIDELSIRLGSRTQGYVNQLCLMEDILVFEYKRMGELLAKAANNQIIINPEADLKDLRDKLSPVRTFRNKVTAHTAYTYSRKEDNPETIVRSILNLFPEPAKITVGDNFFSGFSPHVSQLPVISIFQWGKVTKPIFEDWKQFFLGKLQEVQKQCPIQNKDFNVEVAYPHLIQKTKD